MSSSWPDKDVFKFIQVWSAEGILKGVNKHVYKKLSRELATVWNRKERQAVQDTS